MYTGICIHIRYLCYIYQTSEVSLISTNLCDFLQLFLCHNASEMIKIGVPLYLYIYFINSCAQLWTS